MRVKDKFEQRKIEREITNKVNSKSAAKIKHFYQNKKSSLGSDELYRLTVALIRMYPVYLQIIENVDELRSKKGMGMDFIKSSNISNPTETDAFENMDIRKKSGEALVMVKIIESAFKTIPEEYRLGVYLHLVEKMSYKNKRFDFANRNTWKKWTSRVIEKVAMQRYPDAVIIMRNINNN